MDEEKGSALILALILSMLLLAMGLGLAFSSLNDFLMSKEFERRQQALVIAEAGLGLVKAVALRGVDLTEAAETVVQVPAFLDDASPAEGTFAARNPIPLREARVVDYRNPPAAVGAREVPGLLTNPLGDPIGQGRFFAKITRVPVDLDAALPGPGSPPLHAAWDAPHFSRGRLLLASASPWPSWAAFLSRMRFARLLALNGGAGDGGEGMVTVDASRFVLRIVGVHPFAPAENTGFGSNVRNSVAVIEVHVKRDSSFDLSAPVILVGPDVTGNLNGNAFDIVGDEDHAGVGFLYDNPAGGDAAAAMQSLFNTLRGFQRDNIRGAAGPYGDEPSLRDDTAMIRDDPERAKIMDPNFLADFAAIIGQYADERYTDESTHLSGGNIELGTLEEPRITVVDGDLILTGGGSGAGLLVVRGDFSYRGAFNYHGLVLVLGEGDIEFSGANKTLTGGVLVANLQEEDDGSHSLGPTSLRFNGNSDVIFDGGSIRMALNLFPVTTWNWREITPEIEPVEN